MEVFSNKYMDADVWDMQGAIIRFGSGSTTSMDTDFSSAPVIATQVTVGYGRQITKKYPINVRRAIYMIGTPQGSLSMAMLFGPGQAIQNFIQMFGGAAADENLLNNATGGESQSTIIIKPFGSIIKSSGSGGQTGSLGLGTWKIISPVLTTIGLTVSESGGSQIPAIGQCSMEFVALEIN